MTVIYLSGPMTGEEDHGRLAFDQAARHLRDAGHTVVSPVEVAILAFGSWEAAKVAPRERHIENDLHEVLDCDEVCFLPGWEESIGAREEARVGLLTGKQFSIYDATLKDPASILGRLEVEQKIFGTSGPYPLPPSNPFDASLTFESPYDAGRFVSYEENPQRHVFGSGGIKDNRGKPRIDLIPSAPLIAMAEVLDFGTRKYQPHNWRRGLPWPDTYSSLMRHLLAWNDGEDLDPETGLPHLAHAECQLTFLLDYVLSGVGKETDNRFIPCQAEGCLRALHPTTDHRQEEVAS